MNDNESSLEYQASSEYLCSSEAQMTDPNHPARIAAERNTAEETASAEAAINQVAITTNEEIKGEIIARLEDGGFDISPYTHKMISVDAAKGYVETAFERAAIKQPQEDQPWGAQWNEGCFNDGAEARIVHNAPIAACPGEDTIGKFAADSWRAGWKDADRELAGTALKQVQTEKRLNYHTPDCKHREGHCPTCDSPSPERHPAVQSEGEVSICSDPYHIKQAQESTAPSVEWCKECGEGSHWQHVLPNGRCPRLNKLQEQCQCPVAYTGEQEQASAKPKRIDRDLYALAFKIQSMCLELSDVPTAQAIYQVLERHLAARPPQASTKPTRASKPWSEYLTETLRTDQEIIGYLEGAVESIENYSPKDELAALVLIVGDVIKALNARAAQPPQAPTTFVEKRSHGCSVACANIDLWVSRCPRCGMPSINREGQAPQSSPRQNSCYPLANSIVSRHTAGAERNEALIQDVARELEMAANNRQVTDVDRDAVIECISTDLYGPITKGRRYCEDGTLHCSNPRCSLSRVSIPVDEWNTRRPSVDPASLSAERCAEILNKVKHRGYGYWYAAPEYGTVLFRAAADTYGLKIPDAQIIAAFYLASGKVEL